jgi:hypothetical protein
MNKKSKTALLRYLNRIDKGIAAAEFGECDLPYVVLHQLPSSYFTCTIRFLEVEKLLDFRRGEVSEIVDEPSSARFFSSVSLGGAARRQDSCSAQNLDESAGSTFQDFDSGPRHDENGDKLLSVTQIFQHVQRCRKVLDEICEDPFASTFFDPVDLNVHPDYLEAVTTPMSLNEVREKLDSGCYGKYNQHMLFAKDMRLIWDNCKVYNVYKSSMWYAAHALALKFDRLFQAWVCMFSDGTVGIHEPEGQPWLRFCRICLDEREENDDKLLLCDHCDAPFHIYCLRPPMDKVRITPATSIII